MFEIISSLLKYAFAIIIYLFIFNIIRLIFIDIRSMSGKGKPKGCYLKLVSVQGVPDFKVEEAYPLVGNDSIGRYPDNTICLADPFLSETHTLITGKRKTFYLKDNKSLNGTYLNGKRLGAKPARLKSGDTINAGRTEFLFVCDKRRGGG